MKFSRQVFPITSRALFTIVGGAVLINPVFAQEQAGEELEEVVVTGLRGSLKASMETKRDALGVVDAINAEDIGKFPDTNLSEALQRITGVSIDRRNGEGALVTARGFGPQFNMVTLNGRQMPTADAFANGQPGSGGVSGDSRAFNFANLAADSISAVEVYKTGRADLPSGGIGATVNVRTARPLDANGIVANFGVKALSDTTNRVGNDITPEVTGIFSFANDAKTFGVGLAASYSKRDSGSLQATVNDWNIQSWNGSSIAANNASASLWTGGTPQITNVPADGQLYAEPQDIRYAFSDVSRERVNSQLTLQFVPLEGLTLTVDGTYANNDIVENRGEQGMWMQRAPGPTGGFFDIEFSDGEVATPLVIKEYSGAGKDFAFAQQHREQKNDLRSVGFNADWDVSEKFKLGFDFHNSRARSLPDDPITGASQTEFSVAGRVPGNSFWVQQFTFNSGMPIAARTLYPTAADALAGTNGNPNYAFDASSIGTQMLTMSYQDQASEIKQARLDGDYSFENGKFSFGAETRSMQSTQHSSQARAAMGSWGVADSGTVPDMFNMLTPFSITGAFDDYNPIAGGAAPGAFRGNADQLGLWALDHYPIDYDSSSAPDGQLRYDPGFSFNSTVQEDTKAVYAQAQFQFELGGKESHLVVGARYEQTDVLSTNNILPPDHLIWQDQNGFTVINATTKVPVTAQGSYHNLLPNLDFDMQLTDSIKGRFSYSKTLARAGYTSLAAGASVTGGGQGSSLFGFTQAASQNNPNLLPLESDNFDLSLEYYFSDKGYVSVGAFLKNVENFIGNEVVRESLFGVRDQTAGPRALAAQDWLVANGYTSSSAAIFQAILMTENPGGVWNGTNDQDPSNDVFLPGGLANYNPANYPAWAAARDAAGNAIDVLPQADDPLYQFAVRTPTNNQKAKIHGFELGGQYFFGDTGFGVLANYTIVKGDVPYDNAGAPGVNQFALLGLSDSANAVLMFEKFGVSARLAYNWRGEFLANANNGGWTNPIYVEAYDQFDLSVGYDINDHLAVSFEGINLTGEDVRWHGRTKEMLWRLEDQGSRFALGARYKF